MLEANSRPKKSSRRRGSSSRHDRWASPAAKQSGYHGVDERQSEQLKAARTAVERSFRPASRPRGSSQRASRSRTPQSRYETTAQVAHFRVQGRGVFGLRQRQGNIRRTIGVRRRRSQIRQNRSFGETVGRWRGLFASPKVKATMSNASARSHPGGYAGSAKHAASSVLRGTSGPVLRGTSGAKARLLVSWWNSVVNALVLGLLVWALIWLFVSDQFYVYQIAVEGNQRVSTDAIISASEIDGYSIFWINARQVAASIVESLPPVKRVRVRYSLPNSLTLAIEEQGEQVMWSVAGQRYWVDDDGHFHPAQGGDEPKLLVKDIRPGLPTEVETSALAAARQLTYLLPELGAVEYAPVTGLRFTHEQGWIVYLGTDQDMARKITVLQAIERQLSADGARQPLLVDLRFPDTPYYRFPDEDLGEAGH